MRSATDPYESIPLESDLNGVNGNAFVNAHGRGNAENSSASVNADGQGNGVNGNASVNADGQENSTNYMLNANGDQGNGSNGNKFKPVVSIQHNTGGEGQNVSDSDNILLPTVHEDMNRVRTHDTLSNANTVSVAAGESNDAERFQEHATDASGLLSTRHIVGETSAANSSTNDIVGHRSEHDLSVSSTNDTSNTRGSLLTLASAVSMEL